MNYKTVRGNVSKIHYTIENNTMEKHEIKTVTGNVDTEADKGMVVEFTALCSAGDYRYTAANLIEVMTQAMKHEEENE